MRSRAVSLVFGEAVAGMGEILLGHPAVSGDLGDKATDDEIRTKMSQLLVVAKDQLLKEA